EEAKLQRLPKPKPLDGRVALVTGGAGGIGSAIARRLVSDGASVVLADIDGAALQQTVADLQQTHGVDRVRGVEADVTSESAVSAAFAFAAREFGGLDILVSNAGIASASPVDETTIATWQRNIDILATGYFLVARDGFVLMHRQGRGGAILFAPGKQALVAPAGGGAHGAATGAGILPAECLDAVRAAPAPV